MAHHGNTPKTILNAPRMMPDPVWISRVVSRKGTRSRRVQGTFVGDVERDLLKVAVGTSRKGRKIRRAGR